MNQTLYVNNQGVADSTLGNVRRDYIDEAVNRLRARAGAAGEMRSATAAVPPPAVVNDLSGRTGIMGRLRDLGPKPRVAPPAGTYPGAAPPAAASPPAATAPPTPAAAPPPAAPTPQGGILSRARGTAKAAGKSALRRVVAPIAVGASIADAAADDSTARYAQRFNVAEPTGDGSAGDLLKFAALRAGGFASDLGNNLSGGIVGRMLYRDQPGVEQPPAGAAPPQRPPGPAGAQPRAAAQPEQTTQDLGALLDNPGFVPEAGTGLARNDTTGRTHALGGDVSPEDSGRAAPAEGQAMVRLPDASQVLNSGTVDDFLTQYSGAANTIVANNQENAAKNRGIVQRKASADATKAEAEAGSSQRLDQVFEALLAQDDQTDPDGTRRQQLTNLALTLGGHAPQTVTDTPEDRYLRSLSKEAFGDFQSPEARDAAQEWIDKQMETYRARRGGGASPQAQPFQEGKVYVDAKGNRAMFQGGKWVAA